MNLGCTRWVLAWYFVHFLAIYLQCSSPGHHPLPPVTPSVLSGSNVVDTLVTALTQVLDRHSRSTGVRSTHPPPSRDYAPRDDQYRPPPRQTTPGGVATQNTPRWASQPRGPAPGNGTTTEMKCNFCSKTGHFLRECTEVDAYIRDNRIIRRNGKLCLPNGRYLPGINMKESVASWEEQQQDNRVSTNYLECIDECVFSVDISPEDFQSNPSPAVEMTEDEEADLAIAQVNAATSDPPPKKSVRWELDGVYPPARTIHPNALPQQSSSSSQKKPNVFSRKPGNPANQSAKVGPPGDRANDKTPAPAQLVTLPPKVSPEEGKTRFKAPVEDTVITNDITERALDAEITITARELLAISPESRKQVKELLVSKKVSANFYEEDDIDPNDIKDVPGAVSVFLEQNRSSKAVASLPLRVIFPTFAPGVKPECILDGGSQIVAMSRDVWNQLPEHIITANKATTMESANAGTTYTLGMLENFPIQIGPITVHLQIQVVDDCPFEVLLGRPFFDVTGCVEVSKPGGEHEIHIFDPVTGTPYRLQTMKRGPRKDKQKAAVNFRQ